MKRKTVSESKENLELRVKFQGGLTHYKVGVNKIKNNKWSRFRDNEVTNIFSRALLKSGLFYKMILYCL